MVFFSAELLLSVQFDFRFIKFVLTTWITVPTILLTFLTKFQKALK